MIIKDYIKKIIFYFGYSIGRREKTFAETQWKEEYYKTHKRKFEWLKEFNFSHIIDVGANEGQFAGSISLVFPEAELYCFEPIKSVYEQLLKNFKLKKNIRFYNYALGEIAENKEIFRNEHSPSSSLLQMLDLHKSNFDYAIKVKPEKIEVKPLDIFFNNISMHSLLIKIDVQGYEMKVLKGGIMVLHQAKVIIIETSFYPLYEGQPLFDEVYNFLINLGFKYFGNIEQLKAPIDERILQADSVFIRDKFGKGKYTDVS